MKNRTPKSLGTRHEPSYVHRQTRFAFWRKRLEWGLAIAAVGLLGIWAFLPYKNKRVVYSQGPVASAHAFIAGKCELCHSEIVNGQIRVGWVQGPSDGACLVCHEAPAHHSPEKKPIPTCGSCHVEHQGHQGLMRLSHVQDRACLGCHKDLDRMVMNTNAQPKDAQRVHRSILRFNGSDPGVDGNHPEFRMAQERMALLDEAKDKSQKKLLHLIFHHAKHVGPPLMVRRGDKSETVTLQCSDCHRPVVAADSPKWKYSLSSTTIPLNPSNPSSTIIPGDPNQQPHADAGREIMTMPTYEKNCAACHDLQFDCRFKSSAYHPNDNSKDELTKLHDSVSSQFQKYIDSNKTEIHSPDQPCKDSPVFSNSFCAINRACGLRIPEMRPLPGASSQEEWVQQRVARAERDVLGGWQCYRCHDMVSAQSRPPELASIPELANVPAVKELSFKWREKTEFKWNEKTELKKDGKAEFKWIEKTTFQWREKAMRQMPRSIFSHESHITLTCGSCHGDLPAVASCCQDTPVVDRDIPDVKLPGIKTCETCHNGNPADAGHAENSCFLCHQYHKWNGRTGQPGKDPTKYKFTELGFSLK